MNEVDFASGLATYLLIAHSETILAKFNTVLWLWHGGRIAWLNGAKGYAAMLVTPHGKSPQNLLYQE